MEYRPLGLTELNVSKLCLGTMQFGWTTDETASLKVLSAAYEAGVNFFDGNPGGVSERILGKWLKESVKSRDKVILATKVRGNMGGGTKDEGLSREHIMKSVENSLRRLQTDYIDLYQVHWPDDETPIEETMRAFDELVKQGKIRYVGASNFAAWQFMQALWVSDRNQQARFDSLQPHYSLVHRDEFERELSSVCKTYKIGVIPYSPLAGGFLTGKYRRNLVPHSARVGGVKRYFTERNWSLLDHLDALAIEKNANIGQVALAWLLANPLIVSPIIGVNSVDQLMDNLGAVGVHLTPAEMNQLDSFTSWQDAENE
jgi:aryl-alcohol dehydrogenase-like predicted oxidoreductase